MIPKANFKHLCEITNKFCSVHSCLECILTIAKQGQIAICFVLQHQGTLHNNPQIGTLKEQQKTKIYEQENFIIICNKQLTKSFREKIPFHNSL